MNEILQIIGSIASIGSIPLAIYLYLKSQVQKYLNIRRDIVNRLSFQIGEGRRLTLFEIQAVIESKVRENRIRSNIIAPDEIIEDLVTETINSPLLESEKKGEIIKSLSEVHSLAKLYTLVSSDIKIFNDFVEFLKESKPESEIEKIKKNIENEKVEVSKKVNVDTPELFARIGVVITVFAALIGYSGISNFLKIIPKIAGNSYLTPFLIGLVASIIAAAITAIIKTRITKRSSRTR